MRLRLCGSSVTTAGLNLGCGDDMGDLEHAIAYALEPMTQRGQMTLCQDCGAVKNSLEAHRCPTSIEMPGVERDDKRRARSYAID